MSMTPATIRRRREPAASACIWLIAASLAATGGVVAEGAVGAQAGDQAEEKAEDAAGDGRPARPLVALVRIKLPLAAGADGQARQTLTRARDRLLAEAAKHGDGRRPTLVVELAPDERSGVDGVGGKFETAFSLARFLASRETTEVRTVAWLPRTVRGHGVLVALACEQIAMGPEAELGDAAADEPAGEAVSPTVVAGYREIAESRRTAPTAIAASMIDAAVEAVRVDGEDGVRVLPREEVEDYRRDHEVIEETVLSPKGSVARYTGRDGRELGFVSLLAADKSSLARGLGVTVDELAEQSSLSSQWNPVTIELRGRITPAVVGQIKTLLGDNMSQGANWICLRIDSVGGDVPACIELAGQIARLDSTQVRTVAYVPVEARGGAALVALACDELVMHPTARVGVGPDAAAPAPAPPRRDDRRLPPPGAPPWQAPPPPGDDAAQTLANVASIRESLSAATERPWSLLAAMIDPGVELRSYRNKVTAEERLMSEAEASALADAADWSRGPEVMPAGEPFSLSGEDAAKQGLAAPTIDNFDQLRLRFGIDREVPVVEPSWALRLVQLLGSPSLGMFLLFLGFIGAYVELKTPGVGLGAAVALVSFALFFWSRYLDQTAGTLEIVMFLVGLLMILMEVFVLPGFGIFGLGGGLLIISSLILASQTFVIPRTEAELAELRRSMTVVAGAGAGVFALAFALRHVLPRAPVLNRMVLEPPPPEERITLSSRESLAHYSHLVGVQGEATTDLRPAGKALIDDQLIDVIAEGLPLDRGTRVVVVAAQANRVVVRAV